MRSGLNSVPRYSNGVPQLFQPTVTVATSAWASSLLIEYTKDESLEYELNEEPGTKSWDSDKKTIISHTKEYGPLRPRFFCTCFFAHFRPLLCTVLTLLM